MNNKKDSSSAPVSRTHFIFFAASLVAMCVFVGTWVSGAAGRFERSRENTAEPTAVASAADEGYCSTELKTILRRVLTSCGLLNASGGRGCQPLEAKSVSSMSGSDFNALFSPLAHRAAILQFDQASAVLDDPGRTLLESTFSDQRGASYFFVVSRSSPEGSVERNRELSAQRAEAVLDHLKATFHDPDLDKEIGLLWLGEEFAQLEEQFCQWNRSRTDSPCTPTDLNRSAFIAWIDCRL